jgi:hypothetical protein
MLSHYAGPQGSVAVGSAGVVPYLSLAKFLSGAHVFRWWQ